VQKKNTEGPGGTIGDILMHTGSGITEDIGASSGGLKNSQKTKKKKREKKNNGSRSLDNVALK